MKADKFKILYESSKFNIDYVKDLIRTLKRTKEFFTKLFIFDVCMSNVCESNFVFAIMNSDFDKPKDVKNIYSSYWKKNIKIITKGVSKELSEISYNKYKKKGTYTSDNPTEEEIQDFKNYSLGALCEIEAIEHLHNLYKNISEPDEITTDKYFNMLFILLKSLTVKARLIKIIIKNKQLLSESSMPDNDEDAANQLKGYLVDSLKSIIDMEQYIDTFSDSSIVRPILIDNFLIPVKDTQKIMTYNFDKMTKINNPMIDKMILNKSKILDVLIDDTQYMVEHIAEVDKDEIHTIQYKNLFMKFSALDLLGE